MGEGFPAFEPGSLAGNVGVLSGGGASPPLPASLLAQSE
ncbi:Hypothetical protein CAP_1561 [Chondromyces apiculatus DSM 436]|uniref:Uncharacterized protein n=1 Tax=Chondromyces apiculatus DSM 436 TaxID=1192034 RepID=A0A017TC84_9BACT|nr:Hypothetical protein CAP_1561 [Chondromyces apiculatus DSM 436]